jgi:hypothetical protein
MLCGAPRDAENSPQTTQAARPQKAFRKPVRQWGVMDPSPWVRRFPKSSVGSGVGFRLWIFNDGRLRSGIEGTYGRRRVEPFQAADDLTPMIPFSHILNDRRHHLSHLVLRYAFLDKGNLGRVPVYGPFDDDAGPATFHMKSTQTHSTPPVHCAARPQTHPIRALSATRRMVASELVTAGSNRVRSDATLNARGLEAVAPHRSPLRWSDGDAVLG